MEDKKEKLEDLLITLDNLKTIMTSAIDELSTRVENALKEANKEQKSTFRVIPFDIEKAKQGAKVVTRDGHNVRILCFDRNSDIYPIVALVQKTNSEEDEIISYTKHGYYFESVDETGDDLFIEEECV